MTQDAQAVVVSVPGQTPFVRVARLVGAGLANDIGLDVERLDDVRLAIGEVCSLGVQAGAATIDLRYELTDRGLEVTGECVLPDPPRASPEDEHVSLVRLILEVACSDHRVTRDDGRFSFWLAFAHGS
jgi:hypothetical protein